MSGVEREVMPAAAASSYIWESLTAALGFGFGLGVGASEETVDAALCAAAEPATVSEPESNRLR